MITKFSANLIEVAEIARSTHSHTGRNADPLVWILFSLSLCVSHFATAVPVTWYVNSSTITGSFVYDADTTTTLSASLHGASYDYLLPGSVYVSQANPINGIAAQTDLSFPTGFNPKLAQLQLATDGILTDAGGTYTLLPYSGPPNQGSYICIADVNTVCTKVVPVTGTVTSCGVNPDDVHVFAGEPISRDGKRLVMNAQFTPKDSNGNPIGLDNFKKACGYIGFNWQQQITSWPAEASGICPSSHFLLCPAVPQNVPLNLGSNGSLHAQPQFFDPPPGGYTYNYPDAYPFYYPLYWLNSESVKCLGSPPPIETANTLWMTDCPTDPRLPAGEQLSFKTSLVGVLAGTPLPLSVQNGVPSPPLKEWTWTSNFNGRTGGVQNIVQTASLFAPDPNSGTGGVTITGLDGVPQTPPAATCTATVLARDDKPPIISVSGTVTPGTSPIAANGTTYTVTSRKGTQLRAGSFEAGAEGVYSFELLPIKSDDDQTLSVLVIAADGIGNVGSCSAKVKLPDE